MANNYNRLAAAAATILVLAGVVAGYRMIGSPKHQREVSADERRVNDLQSLSMFVHLAPGKNLPLTIRSIDPGSGLSLRDPLTNTPYEYIPGSGTKYQLCANFSFSSSEAGRTPWIWDHPRGHHCYMLDAADSYPRW